MTGSSPRVWGQEDAIIQPCDLKGIIPTRMGTRGGELESRVDGEDHPHAYGDKHISTSSLLASSGSSPRVWGQVGCSRREVANYGIIPTRMGTSQLLCYHSSLYWDHPHAYGDKFHKTFTKLTYRGSSPRVWGQETLQGQLLCYHRIIPTRMGTRTSDVKNADGE